MGMHREMFFIRPEPGVQRDSFTRISMNCTLTADMGEFKAGDVVEQIQVDYDDQSYLFYHRSFTHFFYLVAEDQG